MIDYVTLADHYGAMIQYIRVQVDGHTIVDFVNGSRICSCGLVRGEPPNMRGKYYGS